MSPEMLTIIGVGVALGALMLAGHNRINKRIDLLEQRMSSLEQRVSRIDGLMEGIREALFERVRR